MLIAPFSGLHIRLEVERKRWSSPFSSYFSRVEKGFDKSIEMGVVRCCSEFVAPLIILLAMFSLPLYVGLLGSSTMENSPAISNITQSSAIEEEWGIWKVTHGKVSNSNVKFWNKGPYLNDVRKIYGIFDPPSPLVTVTLTRLISTIICFLGTPSPPPHADVI